MRGFRSLAVLLFSLPGILWAGPSIVHHRDLVPLVQSLSEKYGAQNVLVVYDFDYTLFHRGAFVSTAFWWEEQKKVVQAGKFPVAEVQNGQDLLAYLFATAKRQKYRLMENDLPEIIGGFQKQGVHVELLSSREAVSLPVVEKSLRENGIDFSASAVPGLPEKVEELLSTQWDRPMLHRHGLFLSANVDKGQALDSLFQHTEYQPRAVILVDDSPHKLARFEASLQKRGIEAYGVFYEGGQLTLEQQRAAYRQANGDAELIAAFPAMREDFRQLRARIAADYELEEFKRKQVEGLQVEAAGPVSRDDLWLYEEFARIEAAELTSGTPVPPAGAEPCNFAGIPRIHAPN